MKEKLLVFAVALLMVASVPGVSFSQDEATMGTAGFAVKAGIDLGGEVESEGESADMDMGFTLGAEYLFPLGVVNLGPGLAFLIPRGVDEEGATGDLGFLPLYVAVNVPIPMQGSILPYIFGRVGYSIITEDSAFTDNLDALGVTNIDSEGGIYWGIGAGVLFAKNIMVELCYATHAFSVSGELGGEEDTLDGDYTYINLSVGYKF